MLPADMARPRMAGASPRSGVSVPKSGSLGKSSRDNGVVSSSTDANFNQVTELYRDTPELLNTDTV